MRIVWSRCETDRIERERRRGRRAIRNADRPELNLCPLEIQHKGDQ